MALLTSAARRLLLTGCLAGIGGTIAPAAGARAQTSPSAPAQEVKAAYLLNFTRYVDWPPGAFAAPADPVNVCVLGESAFGQILRRIAQGRLSRGRPLRVLEPDAPARAGDCHLAFVAGPPRDVSAWLAALRRSPTLTVGDGREFLGLGGMVAFVNVDQTIRFEIDAAAVRRAGLLISSRVLALATRVTGEPPSAP